MKTSVLALASILAACTKTDPKPDPMTSSSNEVPTFQIQGTPPPSNSVAAPAASASSGAPALTVTATTTAVAATGSAEKTAVVPDAGKKDLPATTAAASRITGKNFALDLATPGCRVNESCQMTIRVTAGDGYHVNKDYPYKFLPKDTTGIEFTAKQFSRDAGDFKEDGAKAGVMTVRFKPTASGKAKVTGTYKMSVCSDENCQIEQPAIDFEVPVL